MEWFRRFYSKEFMDFVGFASPAQTRTEAIFVKQALDLPAGARVLDLCCGYGRPTRLLAELGRWEMTGLDLSEDYLALARSRFSGPNITYVMGDMRSLPYECSFDGVINLFTSFGFFDTDEENENVLKEVAKALKPQGVFLLDTENKVHFLVHGVLKQRRTWKLGDDGRMYLIENEYDAKNGREIFRLSIISGGRIKETTGYNIRLYRYPKICRMLSRRGFDVAAVWGDYDRSAYSVDSRRQIILASKQK